MPWFKLRAIYRYVKKAGPASNPAPAFAPPGQGVSGPGRSIAGRSATAQRPAKAWASR